MAQRSRMAPTVSAASITMASSGWVYLSVVSALRCPSSRANGEDGFALPQGDAGMGMAKIVKTDVVEVRLGADRRPEMGPASLYPDGPPVRGAGKTHRSIRSIPSRTFRAGPDSQTVRGPVLLSRQEETAFPVVGPTQRQDLALAAAREEEKTDGRDLQRLSFGMGRQCCGQAANLVVGQEALPPFPAIAPDAPAGVGALGTKAHRFRLPHDDGEHRHGAIGRDRGSAERGEPVADLPAVDVGNRASREARQDLVAQVAPVHLERSRLPDPLVALEHDLSGGLEEGLAGMRRRILPSPDRGQHLVCATPCLPDAHGVGISDDPPDTFAAMLAVDEEALAARG